MLFHLYQHLAVLCPHHQGFALSSEDLGREEDLMGSLSPAAARWPGD